MLARLSRVFDFDVPSEHAQALETDKSSNDLVTSKQNYNITTSTTYESKSKEELNNPVTVNKSSQTDVTYMMEMSYDVVDIVANGNQVHVTSTNESTTNTSQSLAHKDNQIESLQTEIGFLKNELGTKQQTIDHLLHLLQSNMEMSKKMGRELMTSWQHSSDKMCSSDDGGGTLVGGSSPKSQMIHDWQTASQLLLQDLTLLPDNDDGESSSDGGRVDDASDDDVDDSGNDFQDSLNSNNFTKSMGVQSDFETFTDSLEANVLCLE